MNISKIKGIFALLTGGLSGFIKYGLDVFNVQVLGRIPNKEMGVKYIMDVQAFSLFLRTVTENHKDDLTEKRREALNAILAATDELAKALEDFKIEESELEKIIAKVKDAIDAFKKAK